MRTWQTLFSGKSRLGGFRKVGRRLVMESLETRAMFAGDFYVSARHNLVSPSDVNMDGRISPIDALVVIDEINRGGRRGFGGEGEFGLGSMMADTNNDGSVGPLDALLVVDTLNKEIRNQLPTLPQGNGSGSGGGAGEAPDGVMAVEDTVVVYVGLEATSKPSVEIDVLVNDMGEGLRIVEVSPPATGTATIQPSSVDSRNMVIVYTPNEQGANYDRFWYTIEGADGQRSMNFVSVLYELKSEDFQEIELVLPLEVEGKAGEEIVFRNPDLTPMIQVQYNGSQRAHAGVYVSWAFPEGYYVGQRFVGELQTTATTSEAMLYRTAGGNAWIYGELEDVNRILANLRYVPAPGYSAPEGIGLNVYASVSNAIGIRLGSQFGSTQVKVIDALVDVSPRAIDDFFTVARDSDWVLLDVLANDLLRGDAASSLTVEITPAEHTDSAIAWDASARKVRFRPGIYTPRFGDQFAYTLRNSEGRASLGVVTVIFE